MSKFRSSPPKPKNDESPHEPLRTEGENFERLQKVLASAGLGSRRACEELITTGRVDVDGVTITKLGSKVDPSLQVIRVDGEPLPKPKLRYFLVNKPLGVVTTNSDPAGRARVIDLVKSDARLFPVGRLDKSSEGLIIVTNDGELANLLAHPRYGVEKTYLALVAGEPERDVLKQLTDGVHLAEGWAHAKTVRIRAKQAHSSLLEIVLDEGRNREVRRLLARVGHKVLRLQRIAQGSLRLGNLRPGEYRPLAVEEVEKLKKAALESIRRGPKDKKPRKPREIKEAIEIDVKNEIENVEVNPLVDSEHSVTGAVIADETTKSKSPRGRKPKSETKPLIDLSISHSDSENSDSENYEATDSVIEQDQDDNDSDEVMVFEEEDDDILVADYNDDVDEESEVDFFMQGFPGGVDAAVEEAQEDDRGRRPSRGQSRGGQSRGGSRPRAQGGQDRGGRESRGVRGRSRGDSERRERRPAGRGRGNDHSASRGERGPDENRGGESRGGGRSRFGGSKFADRRKKFGNEKPFGSGRPGKRERAGFHSRDKSAGAGDSERSNDQHERNRSAPRPVKQREARPPRFDNRSGGRAAGRTTDKQARKPSDRSGPRKFGSKPFGERRPGAGGGSFSDRKPGLRKFGDAESHGRTGGDRKFGGERKFGSRPGGSRPGGKRTFGEGRSSVPRKVGGASGGPRKFGKPEGGRGGPKRFGKKKDDE